MTSIWSRSTIRPRRSWPGELDAGEGGAQHRRIARVRTGDHHVA